MAFSKAAAAMMRQARLHTYTYSDEKSPDGHLQFTVHAPETEGGRVLATVHGQPEPGASARLAETICDALNRAAKRK